MFCLRIITNISKYSIQLFILLSVFISVHAIAQKIHSSMGIDAKNFLIDGKQAIKENKVIMVYVGADYCNYCKQLDKDVINPMIVSGDYNNKVILRRVLWHEGLQLTNFAGDKVTNENFIAHYQLEITPTILFLNAEGKEVSKKIVGYLSPDFFWFYLDSAIEESLKSLKTTSL